MSKLDEAYQRALAAAKGERAVTAYRCAKAGSSLGWDRSDRRLTHGPGVYYTTDRGYAERYCRAGSAIFEVVVKVRGLLPSSSLVLPREDFEPPAPGTERLLRLPEFQALIASLGRAPRWWNVATTLHELRDELGPEGFLAAMRRARVWGTRGRSGHLPEELAVFDDRAVRLVKEMTWQP